MLPLVKSCVRCHSSGDLFPFSMAFQPIVDLQDQRIESHEALVRGPSGEGAGQVLGQLTELNRYAFDQASRVKAIQMAARLKMDGNLNINFMPNAVYEPKACIERTLQAAADNDFPLDKLVFEFTETEQITDPLHVMNIIREYHRHGFKVALDDFATGYSGLLRLAELRPDVIKLDRGLIQDCDVDALRLTIIASILTLGAQIGVKVVIEGVERFEEVEALRSVGARYMQGYYFARPKFEGIVQNAEINWPSAAVT